MQSYDYARRDGVRWLSWDDFSALARQLVEKLAVYEPQAVVGIARAGLFPAAAVACSLRLDLFPARLTRRQGDRVVFRSPHWIVPISPEVAGKRIVVVDEIADTGQTLRLAAKAARQHGASQVLTAALVAHTWGQPAVDEVCLVTDALVVFPWDRQVWMDGRWQLHPEIAQALDSQPGEQAASENE